jgi:Ca2+-binding RTX toxin-like protein
MFVDFGSQTQVNVTNSQQEIQFAIVSGVSGVFSAYISVPSFETSPTSAILRALDANGAPTGTEVLFALPASGFGAAGSIELNAILNLSNGNYAVVYEDNSTTPGGAIAIRAQIYNATGGAIGTPITVKASTGSATFFPSDTVLNPAGGLSVGVSNFGAQGVSFEVIPVSNSGVVGASTVFAGYFNTDVLYTSTGGLVLADGFGTSGFRVDFPGPTPFGAYNFPTGGNPATTFSLFNADVELVSDTTAVAALELVRYAGSSTPNQPPIIVERIIDIVRFVDGQPAQFLNRFTFPAAETGDDSLQQLLRLSDGSFALATTTFIPETPNSSNVIPSSSLYHLSSNGQLLGTIEPLNNGAFAGAVTLKQLANGQLMAVYSGTTPATGADVEVFRELFTVSGTPVGPSNGPDSLVGTPGSDVIDGLGGNDTLLGNDGNDTLIGGAGVDVIFGGNGNDVIRFDLSDSIAGEAGDDTLILTGSGNSANNWTGGAGFDTLDATGLANGYTESGTGVTFISTEVGFGSAFGDYFRAVDGASATSGKTFVGNGGNDTLSGASMNDILIGGVGNDLMFGAVGNDSMFGEGDNDTLWGFDGNDEVRGGTGVDLLFGEAGIDTVDGEDGNDQLFGWVGNDLLLGGEGNDVAFGEQDNDVAFGWIGADSLYGGLGDDTLHGEQDDDLLAMEEGNDLAFGGDGNDLFWSWLGNDTAWGGDGNDVAYGDDGNDLLFGEVGRDTLFGGNGDDQAYGWFGDDVLWGGAGNDLLVGEGGIDLLFGEDGFDTLIGGDQDDQLFGWIGNDLLFGGEGIDLLRGEADNDVLIGEGGNDILLGDEGEDKLYGWTGQDALYGWVGDDELFGEQGDDLLLGEDGNDVIAGGLGRDTMTGGLGADRFFTANFEMAAGDIDRITDYDAADRYLFQTGTVVSYVSILGGAAMNVNIAGGIYILDVVGATTAQLQSQTLFF